MVMAEVMGMHDHMGNARGAERGKAGNGRPPPPLPIVIRWLQEADLAEVFAIQRKSRSTLQRSEHELLTALQEPNCVGFVAEHKEKVVGFTVYKFDKTAIRLLNMAVDSSCRRRGVGRQLMGTLAEKLAPDGPRSVELVVDERRLDAQKFFQACGFMAEGVEAGCFEDGGYDGYRMRLVCSRDVTDIDRFFLYLTRTVDQGRLTAAEFREILGIFSRISGHAASQWTPQEPSVRAVNAQATFLMKKRLLDLHPELADHLRHFLQADRVR
jgi:[ribosomal protein S18]-alanine N-acetyltransferase